jgi:F1F0 ATPase subunit 2
MINYFQALLWILAGGLLGTFFFAGLWWTVKQLATAKRPARLMLTSLGLRMTVTLAGFYGLSAGGWKPLVFALIGFLLARWVVIRLTQVDANRGLLLWRSSIKTKTGDANAPKS